MQDLFLSQYNQIIDQAFVDFKRILKIKVKAHKYCQRAKKEELLLAKKEEQEDEKEHIYDFEPRDLQKLRQEQTESDP